MRNQRSWAVGWGLLLAVWLLTVATRGEPAAAQQSGCGELQCVLPGGGCGWPGNGGCYGDIHEAECYMMGGCDYVNGECHYPANGGCYPVLQAECILAGGAWVNGQCDVTPSNGDSHSVPEPHSLPLTLVGLAIIGLYAIHRRGRVSR